MVSFLATKENDCYILKLNCKDTTCRSLEAVKYFLKKHHTKKLGLDLEKIEKINDDFLRMLNSFRFSSLSLFGVNPNILGYMIITNTLNLVPVYMSKNDFLQEKRKFVKRDFRVIK